MFNVICLGRDAGLADAADCSVTYCFRPVFSWYSAHDLSLYDVTHLDHTCACINNGNSVIHSSHLLPCIRKQAILLPFRATLLPFSATKSPVSEYKVAVFGNKCDRPLLVRHCNHGPILHRFRWVTLNNASDYRTKWTTNPNPNLSSLVRRTKWTTNPNPNLSSLVR